MEQPPLSQPPGAEPAEPSDQAPFGSSFFDSIRRTAITRTHQRWFGGVAGGYARRMNIDPLIVRAVFVGLTIFGGLGIIVYGLSWMLLPEESDGRIHLQEAMAGRFDGALALASAFVLVGLLLPAYYGVGTAGVNLNGFLGPLFGIFIGTLILGGIVAVCVLVIRWVLNRGERKDPGTPHPLAAPFTAAAPTVPEATHSTATEPATSSQAWAHTAAVTPDAARVTEPKPASVTEAAPVPGTATMDPTPEHSPFTAQGTGGQPAGNQSTGAKGWSAAAAVPPPVFSAGQQTAPGATPKFSRRSPGPGRRAVSLAFAVVLLACAGVLAAWQLNIGAGIAYPPVAMAGVSLLGLGLILIVLGIMGRRGGFISLLSIVTLSVGALTAGLTADTYSVPALSWGKVQVDYPMASYTPTSLDELSSFAWDPSSPSYLDLDLSQIPTNEIAARGGELIIDDPAGNTTINIYLGATQPIDIHVTGDLSDVVTWESQRVTYERAVNNGDYYSLAAGGSLTYSTHQAVKNSLQVRVNSPSSHISIISWS